MSITDQIIQDNPTKYETLLEARILSKVLQMKINQYNSLQNQYDNLLQIENNNRKNNTGGTWTDLQNQSYQLNMVSSPTTSTKDWQFLGKTDNLNDCKVKAVQDENKAYSSVVYYTSDYNYGGANTENLWKNSCFGGIKGQNINQGSIYGVTTSLAPNGTTRLGGDDGEKILIEMQKIQEEITTLTKKAQADGIVLDNTKQILVGQISAQNSELNNLLYKLQSDRNEINKLMREPDQTAGEEDSNIQQTSNYTRYGLWLLLAIISFYVAYHIYSREIYDISILAYIFIGIWIIIIGKQYYSKSKDYASKSWHYVSSTLPQPL
jgi:hypothetical protein